jgi:lipopolysaccharide transport system ATP-binding protein
LISPVAIHAEGLGKKYTIHHDGRSTYGSLRETITGATKKLVNGSRAKDECFWALKDISFEVQKGSSLGIIGRNGAGKTTLLKILSRITEPTEGRVVANGRVASLLEVGTGFHQELTGRENIFLNGAILGMSKNEIRKKFDDIVQFSGVEKFLDTAVKHYSSGMSVRLAFAIAAHLQQEILLVDEVLAVGDSEFQKKCMGKMNEVTREEGRTVLFVSHDLGSISQLCQYSMLLNEGKLICHDRTEKVIDRYLEMQEKGKGYRSVEAGKVNFIKEMRLTDDKGRENYSFTYDKPINLEFKLSIGNCMPGLYLAFAIQNRFNKRICLDYIEIKKESIDNENNSSLTVSLPAAFLTPGKYSWDISIIIPDIETFDSPFGVCPFEIIDNHSKITRFSRADYGDVTLKTTYRFDA